MVLISSTVSWVATVTEYDILGRVKRQSVPTEVNSIWEPAGDDQSRGFLWTVQRYDWMGRVVRKINTDGEDSGTLNDSDVLISYAGCGCAGGLETTILGELVPKDDGMGNARRKQKVYADILGRTYKTETYQWEDGAVYSTVVNSFNQRDQVLRSRQFAGDTSSNTYQDTLALFDGHGRLSASHRPEQRDGSNNPAYTTYTYNADDSIATATDARGAVTHYTYENAGGTPKRPLLTGISWSVPQGSGIAVPTAVSYSFDNAGNRIGMTDALGTVAYTYDELSRMTSEARNFSDTLADEPASGVYEVQYTYGLAGGLLSYTDPFGEEIGYSNDKLGRLSSVTGSSFGGVTSYASNPGYRAWGALKSLSYSNGYEMQISFDDRLRASEYDYRKPADPYAWKRHKDFEYYSDGRLKLADETGHLANNRFDRSFTYDHQGRVKEAKSGVEAHGGTETHLMNLPYRQTYTFTPFGQVESRDSTLWNYGVWDFNYTYQNNRRAGGQHDADGRETYGNSTHYEFDASGGLVGTSRSQSFDADMVRDGNGREGKRSQKLWDVEEEEWGEVKSTYQIFSSVLGRTVSEADTTGKKWRTFVIAAGAEIARQAVLENDDEAVTLVHTDPSGVSTFSMSIGTGFAHDTQAMKTEELDGLGNNVGTHGSMSRPPYSGGVMASANDSVTIDDVTMGDCELDGMITPCSMVNRMAGSGALQLEVRYHGPNGFSYWYHDFDNSLPGRQSMSVFIPDYYEGYGSEPEFLPDGAPLPPLPPPFVPSGTWYTLNVSWDTRLQNPQDFKPPSPAEFRKEIQKKYKEKVQECLQTLLSEWANNRKDWKSESDKQAFLSNLEKMNLNLENIYIDARMTGRQLKAKYPHLKQIPYGIPNPHTKPYPTVEIAREGWYNPRDWIIGDRLPGRSLVENAFIHEVGNILSFMFTGSYGAFGDPSADDKDSGNALQNCVWPEE